ncbi:hypothetical protein KEM52_004539 [Ascosphaera acerosa]|nr:hypothetical protein KEM52_004539 [Ascosphaera acerosa]
MARHRLGESRARIDQHCTIARRDLAKLIEIWRWHASEEAAETHETISENILALTAVHDQLLVAMRQSREKEDARLMLAKTWGMLYAVAYYVCVDVPRSAVVMRAPELGTRFLALCERHEQVVFRAACAGKNLVAFI